MNPDDAKELLAIMEDMASGKSPRSHWYTKQFAGDADNVITLIEADIAYLKRCIASADQLKDETNE